MSLQPDVSEASTTALLQLEWRPACVEDIPALHQLWNEIELVDRRGWASTLEDRQRDFQDPTTNPATDSLLAVTPAGKIAAMGWIFSPPVGEREYVAFLAGEVHPAFRGLGLGHRVLNWLEVRGGEILRQRPANLPHVLRAYTHDSLKDRIALYQEHGFQPVRYGYKMRRDLSQPIPEAQLPPGIRLEKWSPDLDQETMAAFNDSFREHFGFIPFNLEVWQLFISGHSDFRPDLSFLALAEDNQDFNPVAGFCVNQVEVANNLVEGIQQGWIQELGVRSPWRRQGIATVLLCASMRAFREAGMETAGLGVDTENQTGALRIYERLGFQPVKKTITFEKKAAPEG